MQRLAVQPPAAMTNSANANPGGGAAQAVGYFDTLSSITSYSSWFSPPAPIRALSNADPASDTTSWTVSNLTVQLVVTEVAGGTYHDIEWAVTLNGSDSINKYDNFAYVTESETENFGDPGRMVAKEPADDPEPRSHGPSATASVSGNMTVYDRASTLFHMGVWDRPWSLRLFNCFARGSLNRREHC